MQIQNVVTQVPQGETTIVSVKSTAGGFNYEFTKVGNDFFVKRSDRNLHFKLSQFEFERIVNVTKARLVAAAPAVNQDPVANLVNQSTQGLLNGEKAN